MTRAKPASREWSGPRPTPEAVRTPSLGFGVPRQSAIVHANPWSSGECRLKEGVLTMGRSVLLWLLGVPIPIIILLALFWH